MTILEPCEKHEVSNCSICSGLDKRLQDAERRPPGSGRRPGRKARIERLPFGVVHADYPGRCADCGVWFEAGEPIRHSDKVDGWVSTECCG